MIRAVPIFALLTFVFPAEQQSPAFSSRVEAVRVDVLVTENGRPIKGLRQADFELMDEGVRQNVDLVLFEQMPLNVVLALDMSGSVSGERLDHLQTAAGALVTGLKPEDRAGLLTFSHMVARRSELTSDFTRIRTALADADAQGGTALVDGVYSAMMLGESDAGRSLLVVFSDGLDTSSWLQADAVLDVARRSDVVVYTVATGGSRRSRFLRELSGLTGGRLFEVESTKNLDKVFVSILEEFRHRYLLTYSPREVARGGWHRLEVRVPRRNTTIKARPGYLGGS
jgi:Ca-activated chloride channel family protein